MFVCGAFLRQKASKWKKFKNPLGQRESWMFALHMFDLGSVPSTAYCPPSTILLEPEVALNTAGCGSKQTTKKSAAGFYCSVLQPFYTCRVAPVYLLVHRLAVITATVVHCFQPFYTCTLAPVHQPTLKTTVVYEVIIGLCFCMAVYCIVRCHRAIKTVPDFKLR